MGVHPSGAARRGLRAGPGARLLPARPLGGRAGSAPAVGGRLPTTGRRAGTERRFVSRSPGRVTGVCAGVGARPGVAADEVLDLIAVALARLVPRSGPGCVVPGVPSGVPPAVEAIATVAARAAEPGLLEVARRLGVPLRDWPAASLVGVAGVRPSARVLAAVGTPSVAEAAALLTAGPGAALLVSRLVSPGGRCTVALAAPPAREHERDDEGHGERDGDRDRWDGAGGGAPGGGAIGGPTGGGAGSATPR
ncbi:hypothetical protein FNQ90_05690 [Streptomyces alkaliphilus]|uniref:CobE/GbiG C-terminal domain-containing protein n=1 Tax=Streptomyces alkaliphilus TaxID=1472722 RepID=A0A7W3TBV9_9ACTN|nr:hypothetical protein [Streptomyces alkaliphilus]